ncbi:glycerol-3-phosphate dehydrogenase/oxidase [Xanthovirga aplysinae]|uniref:glycerol-3-phosphate dehydrogenase/oxidase n=1 Tax=Xanthovirga aplysinae TaxID=2529853 RepID=UPI0012BCD13D|nr:glycerol-3-phosphate dehydrogenase/oxidase [Xanthovirga aplysinae]MTI32574.1 glycerol-3-phosphate dehydrogenase/oxidase [Xanthovirga aplysinae]
MKRFSAEDHLSFDLCIVGGGITGAAIAYEAALKGYKVVLLEKSDFGGGTSAATSKLIHGGLRYLKNLEWGLVRESLKERKTLSNIAPNLVYPLPFIIPRKKGNWLQNITLRIGMFLYDLLSYDKSFTWDRSKKLPNHKLWNKEKVLEEEPLLKTMNNLEGGLVFYDCQSYHPERLTLTFLESAHQLGAKLGNYWKVENFITEGQEVKGVLAEDLLSHKKIEIRAKKTINCAGAWVDEILNFLPGQKKQKSLIRSEGIHILTRKLAINNTISLVTASGRHAFIIPWRNHSLIGTTDKTYHGKPDEYRVTSESIQELIQEVNEALEKEVIQYKDVLAAYGGLRPLVDDQTEESYKASRKYEIVDHAKEGVKGCLSVEGGKYTTSRNLAEHVVLQLDKDFGKGKVSSQSSKKPLFGGDIKNLPIFLKMLEKKFPNLPSKSVQTIGKLYGTIAPKLLRLADSETRLGQVLNEEGEMLVQVYWAIKQESAYKLTDIFLRRTGLGSLGLPSPENLETICNYAAELLEWTPNQLDLEKKELIDRLTVPALEQPKTRKRA